jgi:hypothetical protein
VVAYRVPAGELPRWVRQQTPADGYDHVALRLRVEISTLTRPWRRTAVFLRMRLDDLRARVADTEIEEHQEVRPLWATVSGLRTNTVGWFFEEPPGAMAGPRVLATRVLVELPAGLDALTGTMRVETPLVRATPLFPRRSHARTEAPREFAVSLTGNRAAHRPDTGADRSPPVAMPPSTVRLCLAVDIERFSRFRVPEASRAQSRLLAVLARAREQAGLGGSGVDAAKQGDGQFMVLPAGLDESVVIPGLVHGLRVALAETNADLNEHARLRLRVALHRGHLGWGENGWIGDSAIAVHRLLDSPPVRAALVNHPDVDFALIVPDTLYRDVIAHRYGLLLPEAFEAVDVRILAKRFAERAWVYVPAA